MEENDSCHDTVNPHENALITDPEYELPERVHQPGFKANGENWKIKEQTKKRIAEVVRKQFLEEICFKDNELDKIDAMLTETRCILDRLRACIVTKYYSSRELLANEDNISCVHPSIRKHLHQERQSYSPSESSSRETVAKNKCLCDSNISKTSEEDIFGSAPEAQNNHREEMDTSVQSTPVVSTTYVKSKLQIVVGNVSKYIPLSDRGDNEQHSHIWKAYVREGKNSMKLSQVVEKVGFLLHQTFSPNYVELKEPPFELAQRGWGDFPLRVRIYFKDPVNKPVDIIHRIKLDRTYTGLTTLNAETHAECRILTKSEGVLSFIVKESHKMNSDIYSACDDSSGRSALGTDSSFNAYVFENSHEEVPNQTSGMKFCESSSSDPSDNSCSSLEFDKSSRCSLAVSNDIASNETTFNSSKNLTSIVYVKSDRGREGYEESHNEIGVRAVTHISNPGENRSATNGIFSLFSKKQQPSVQQKQTPLYLLNVVSNVDAKSKGKMFLISPSDKGKLKNQKTVSLINGFAGLSSDRIRTTSTLRNDICGWMQLVQNTDISDCKDFENVLKKIVKKFPLVKEDYVDRSVLPFCCTTKDYTSWTIAKKRAAEWQRAVLLKKAASHLIEKSGIPLPVEKWSHKKVMIWCRKFGYSGGHSNVKDGTSQNSVEWPDGSTSFTSFSNVLDMISSLQKHQICSSSGNVCETEVDVIDVCNSAGEAPALINCVMSPQKCAGAHNSPLSSDAAAFVRNTAAEIKVRLKPVDLGDGIYLPVIEEMMLKACLSFAEDIVRSAASKSYERVGQIPDEVTLMDVYVAVRSSQDFHFLTNKFLAFSKPYLHES